MFLLYVSVVRVCSACVYVVCVCVWCLGVCFSVCIACVLRRLCVSYV